MLYIDYKYICEPIRTTMDRFVYLPDVLTPLHVCYASLKLIVHCRPLKLKKSKILKTHIAQLNMYMNNLTNYIFAVFSGELFAFPCIQLQLDHSLIFICNQVCNLGLSCGCISLHLQVIGKSFEWVNYIRNN